jgi:hypothetical protein
MKIGYISVVVAVGLVFLVTGCQTVNSYSGTGIVAPEKRVAIPEGSDAGKWQGNDLWVEYKYSRSQGTMDLSGTVHFADSMIYNADQVHDFQLSVILVDEKGNVLDSHGLATGRGDLDPIPFRIKLTFPASAVSMAFSYRGTALSSGDSEGGGGTSHFWEYPVHR